MVSITANPVEKPLSHQRQVFVNYYCTDANWNGAEAARLAGYCKNSPDLARIQATQLLTLPNVQAAIEVKKAELFSGIAATREEVMRNHRLAMQLALGKGDLTTYTRNNEDMGKTETLYAERHVNEGEGLTINVSSKPGPKLAREA